MQYFIINYSVNTIFMTCFSNYQNCVNGGLPVISTPNIQTFVCNFPFIFTQMLPNIILKKLPESVVAFLSGSLTMITSVCLTLKISESWCGLLGLLFVVLFEFFVNVILDKNLSLTNNFLLRWLFLVAGVAASPPAEVKLLSNIFDDKRPKSRNIGTCKNAKRNYL